MVFTWGGGGVSSADIEMHFLVPGKVIYFSPAVSGQFSC